MEVLETGVLIKSDLIGADENAKGVMNIFKTTKVKEPTDAFALLNRSEVLTGSDSGIIVPHHAVQRKETFRFEIIFKSVMKLLMDNSSSEYMFTAEFFFSDGKPKGIESMLMVFGQVFDPCLKSIQVLFFLSRISSKDLSIEHLTLSGYYYVLD
jgi:hypothetical protein